MPIATEQEISRADMQKIADTNFCGECGARLTVAYGGAFGIKGHILRCPRNIEHRTTTRHDAEYENKINRERISRKLDSKSLQVMTETQMVERVNMAKFPQDLKAEEKKLLAQVAITYGFDPLMGEITIYQGRPYVSIDGRYRAAQETGELDGVETRPATQQERTDWQIPDGDYFFRAEVYKKGSSRAFTGWGRVRAAETSGGKGFKPIETNPQRMAEKRAEAQALRKAFHIPLPSIEDAGTEDIIETEYKVTVEEPAKEARDPATVRTIDELKKALYEDFGLRQSEQLAELNIKAWPELAIKPSDAYMQVSAVRKEES